MAEKFTESLMDKTIEKIKSMVNTDTVIGAPIPVGDVTLIPVSKVTYGFAAGGSDLPSKTAGAELFGGGGGAGITIAPVAFLSVCGTQVKLLPINQPFTTLDRVVEMVPEAVDKVTGFIQSRKKKGETQPAEDLADEIAAEAAEQIAKKLD